MVEVRRRRRADPVRLVPVIDLVEVHLEDLLLAEGARRLHREDRFLQLARHGRLVAEQPRLDELLRDRRAALADGTAADVRVERPGDAADVDPRVRPERAVLDGDRRLLEALGDRGERHEVAPLVLERVEQVLPGAVVDPRRQGDRERGEVVHLGEVRGDGAGDPEDRDADERTRPHEERREAGCERVARGRTARAPGESATSEAGQVDAAREPHRPGRSWHLLE